MNSLYSLSLCKSCDLSGFIYVIGGISDEGLELRSAEVYDPISRRWSALPVMATRRAYVGVACLNNCIYAVGGWNEALGALETVEKYCPEEVGTTVYLCVQIHLDNAFLYGCACVYRKNG